LEASSSASESTGLLFITDALPLRVADGARLRLGGESWQAAIEGESLKLSKWTTTNDREEQRKQKWSDATNELAKRREEVVSLSADITRLEELCMEVCSFKMIVCLFR
jgi:hypothetical protein